MSDNYINADTSSQGRNYWIYISHSVAWLHLSRLVYTNDYLHFRGHFFDYLMLWWAPFISGASKLITTEICQGVEELYQTWWPRSYKQPKRVLLQGKDLTSF